MTKESVDSNGRRALATRAERAVQLSANPPAIWTAFARQGAWKSWVLVLQLGLNVLLAVAAIGFAHRDPDVVLVEGNGKSTYVSRSIAGEALTRFLTEQRQQPTDITVLHFTRDFLNRFLSVNSSTIDSTWPESLGMMDAPLRSRLAREAKTQNLIESSRMAQVRTELAFEDISLVERLPTAMHVHAVLKRTKYGLGNGNRLSADQLVVDLIERIVPRTQMSPDGLEVAEYRNQVEISSPQKPTIETPLSQKPIGEGHAP